MTDVDLMVIGCLTIGPLTAEQICRMLTNRHEPDVLASIEELSRQERIVPLSGGRWALVHRT